MSAHLRNAEQHQPLALGLLSTARINERIIAAAAGSSAISVQAVASRTHERAAAYAEEHDIGTAHGSYQDLLEDDAIDAVYVSLPNHLHVEWSERALRAGKHVLCEKPLSRERRAVERLVALAAERGLVIAEAFMWRHHPQTRLVEDVIADGGIGQVEHVEATFQFDLYEEYRAAGRSAIESDPRMRPELDGGALMDVGTYCVNAVRRFAGEPVSMSATQELGATGVDVRFAAQLDCGDVHASISCSLVDPRRERLLISGSDGSIELDHPFLCTSSSIVVERDGRRERVHASKANPYECELESFAAEIGGSPPRISAGDTVGQAAALEALTAAARTVAEVHPATLAEGARR